LGSAHVTNLPDALFQQVNPAKIDAHQAAIARELDALDDGND
jgi:hypothetical protein